MDSSNVGTGSILVQEFPEGKKVVSFNSRILDKTEQKLSTMHRELCGIVSALKTYEHYIIGSPHTIYVYCDHKPIIYLWARKGNISARFFHFHLIISQFQNLKIIWTPGKNLAFPDILSRNVTITDMKKYQKKHKHIPKDIKFYDDQGQEVKYFIEHDDEGLSSNDFYPVLCTTSTDQRRLLLINDGHDFEVTEPITNQINSLNDISINFKLGENVNVPRTKIEKDTVRKVTEICEIVNSNTELPVQLSIFSLDLESQAQIDIVKKKTQSNADENLSSLELNFIKLDTPLTTSLLLTEQKLDSVLSQVQEWLKREQKPSLKDPNYQSRAFRNYINNFELLFIDPDTNLVCYKELMSNGDHMEKKICLPLSLMFVAFHLSHSHELSGHLGQMKTLANLKRYFFFPGMFKWVTVLINDCLSCQKNKQKRKDLHEAPLQPWGGLETVPFRTVHIDHKGPLYPSSSGFEHCLVVVDSFSRFIQVYPVKGTSALHTIEAMENWILTFGIPQILVYDRGSAFINIEVTNWATELGITLAPRTDHSPWANGKVEIQNKHLTQYFRHFLSKNGSNWATLAPKFAFAHNTSVNTATGSTPYEIIFGSKPQIPLSLKLGLMRDTRKRCQSEFCEGLPPHAHDLSQINTSLDRLLHKCPSPSFFTRENRFKRLYAETYRVSRETTDKANAHRNKHKLGKELQIGQKVLRENFNKELNKSKKLSSLRSGPYTVLRKITNTTYEIELDENPGKKLHSHRNHLIEYFPKDETVPSMIKDYHRPQESSDDHRQFYRNLNRTAVDDYNQYIPHAESRFTSFPAIQTQGQITINNQKGKTNENDSGFNSWHLNNLFNTPKPCSNTPRAPMGSPDERVFHPNFLSSSTPLPNAHIQSHEQPYSSQLRSENSSEQSMTQMISDSARSNQSSSRSLRESTRFQRLAVPNYVLEREMPDELRVSETTPKQKLYLKHNQKKNRTCHVKILSSVNYNHFLLCLQLDSEFRYPGNLRMYHCFPVFSVCPV